jgi:hypothetical protein
MKHEKGKKLFSATVIIALVGSSCAGRDGPPPRHADDDSESAAATELDEGEGEASPEAAEEALDPICAGYESDELDPLRRWIGAFPIHQGGAVMVFVGARAELMDIETTLEMAAISGYEDRACGTAVVVWVPGMECQGEEAALAQRIEEGSTMTLSEADSTCFRLDEVRARIREECGRGNLAADLCP